MEKKQTIQLSLYSILCQNKADLRRNASQAKKKAIAADLVASEAGMMKSLTKDDVTFLFS